MISEKEKCRRGELYDANYDPELLRERARCKELYYRYNQLPPSRLEERERIIREMLGKTGERFLIEQPFYCDYGYNIEVGENFYANMNCASIRPGIRSTWSDGTGDWSTPARLRSAAMSGLGRRCVCFPG